MINLFRAEWFRTAVLMRRYLGNTLSSALGLVIVFSGLFFGASYMAGGTNFGSRLEDIVVGYVLWSFILSISADVAGDAQAEAQTGTLEQVCLSHYGLTRIFVIRSLTRTLWTLLMNAGVLLILCLITGTRLHFSPWAALPLITALASAYGMALLIGALALTAKRVQQVMGLINFAFLFLLMTPFESSASWAIPLVSWLPSVPSAMGMRTVMVANHAPEPVMVLVMLGNAALWLLLGTLVFRKTDRLVRRHGMMGSY